MRSALDIGFQLDRRFHWLRGEMDQTKEPALFALAEVFERMDVPYAIIGGVALQIHHSEPRTTLDIDVAVTDRAALPRQELIAAGFRHTGSFEHSENWVGPLDVPLQITDDAEFRDAVQRAETFHLRDVRLQVLSAADLLHAKLRAAADPARRRSKRVQDLADAQALLENNSALAESLSAEEQKWLGKINL